MNKKVIAFFHTYARDGEFGTFTNELIKGFENNGLELYIFKVNDLVGNLSNKNYLNEDIENYVLKKIANISPCMIFTTNWAGINSKIMQHFPNIPRVTWMVDRNPFSHNNKSKDEAFDENDIVITSSTSNVQRLEEHYPHLKGNVHFLPFMTAPQYFKHGQEKKYNISFIGSLFANSQKITELFYKKEDSEFRKKVFQYIKEVENNYELDIEATLKKLGLYRKIGMEPKAFHGIVANIISNNKRIKALEKIAPLGLTFFGTKNWETVFNYSIELMSKFQFETFIKTREELSSIYDQSKISININHHQATTGQGYRVFDILASDSLLITNYQKNSDLEVLFGKNHPIPIYKTLDELYDLCKYYIEHDEERMQIVKECNNLIGDKHTFNNRVKEVVLLAIRDFDFNISCTQSKQIIIPSNLIGLNHYTIAGLIKLIIVRLYTKFKKIIKYILRR